MRHCKYNLSMNIFVLDLDPKKAAEYHCNKHVLKMVLETAQMLCTAHWMIIANKNKIDRADFKKLKDMQKKLISITPEGRRPPWKLTHANHPCSKWIRESDKNYWWTVELGINLIIEYRKRYNEIHSTLKVYDWLCINHIDLPDNKKTPHPICVSADCLIENDPVGSYRKYYKEHKKEIAEWEPIASTPEWYNATI